MFKNVILYKWKPEKKINCKERERKGKEEDGQSILKNQPCDVIKMMDYQSLF